MRTVPVVIGLVVLAALGTASAWNGMQSGSAPLAFDVASVKIQRQELPAGGLFDALARYPYVTFKGSRFDALDQLREEWIGDVRHQKADDVTTPRSERSRMGVRVVVKLLDSSQYLLTRAKGDVLRVIDYMGNGCCRNARFTLQQAILLGWLTFALNGVTELNISF